MLKSSPLAHYESFLINNASTISTIESSLRSLTWFLPGRFKDAELASEALSSTLNLISLYHDTLLARRLSDVKQPVMPPSHHSRYTRAWADKSDLYRWAARMLEIIRFVELVAEMGLRRKVGLKGAWRGIIALETLKTALRLFLLKLTRRPLLSPSIPERDLDPSTLPPASSEQPQASTSQSPPSTPDHLKNNRVKDFPIRPPNPLLSPHPQPNGAPQAVEDYLLPRALSTSSITPPAALVRPLSNPKDWISEVIYAIRPLIYVLALSRAVSKKDPSPRPLMISLALDLLSRYLRRTPPPSSTLERNEYARRDRDLLWYFLRGSVWTSYTRPKIEGMANSTSNIPIIGFIGLFVKDWMPLIDEYYYYTAT